MDTWGAHSQPVSYTVLPPNPKREPCNAFSPLTLPAACRLLHRLQPLYAGATYSAVARGNKVDPTYDSGAPDGSPEDGLAVASTTCDDPTPQPLGV